MTDATKINVKQFIQNNFKNTDYKSDKLHIKNIRNLLFNHGCEVGNKITPLLRENN
jgi:hypothetical protein